MFSDLIEILSGFESLRDLHIIHHPYATLPHPDYPGFQLAVRRLHESNKDLVKELLSALPGLYRVGMGKNSVWERQTRWKEDGIDEFFAQRLTRARVPSFYDAGSSLLFANKEEGDKRPAIRDVLTLLEKL